jgi:HSP20 family molecular chaperone IbpA
MWAEACALLERAEQLRRQFFEPARDGAVHARWEPPVDIFETDSELVILAALPGVAPEAVQVEFGSGLLRISGSRTLPTRGRNARIVRLEIPYGGFERRIALQTDRLKLTVRELIDGCLVLTFAKHS